MTIIAVHTVVEPASTATRPPLVTPKFIAVSTISFGSMISFYLLAAAVPAYVAAQGGSTTLAGATTGALMLGTLVVELMMRHLSSRFSCRVLIRAGLVLLGLPALTTPFLPAGNAWLLTGCALRGVGFGVIMVSTGVVLAEVLPAERRGEGFGLYGIIVGVPSIVALPFGLWFAAHLGYGFVFVAAGIAALSGIALTSGLPDAADESTHPSSLCRTIQHRNLLGPIMAFASTTVAVGVVITFLPVTFTRSATTVTMALAAQAITSTIARWAAGRIGDRRGHGRLLGPGVVLAALGMAGLVLGDHEVVAVVSMLVFGTGFGVALSASMAIMLERVTPADYPAVSALWNLTYDGGWGLGAIGFGILTGHVSYAVAFALTACVMLLDGSVTARWR